MFKDDQTMTHNTAEAIDAYKLFLQKKPNSPHAPLVKARIKSLEERLSRKNAKKETAAAPAVMKDGVGFAGSLRF